ncbi:hypothetical protein [Lachnoclostridium sp. An118]|uniref:hypothetical protein n=1 Tax=Lachnoclostridium sp. An118 TaxID=1965547 RepID=UPI001FA90C7F|nr:hypothetical protein [Lachnoclostridium sp. An118]
MSMRKERKIINTNIRLNLLDEADRQAWKYLQTMNRKKYKSYTRAVVAAVNDYFGREYEKEEDPYLETREKEDAFLRQVQNAIKEGVKESVPMLLAKNLMELLYPYMNGVGQPFMQEKEEGGFAFDSVDREQEENADAALDFADSF